ncbi:MAG: bifunctional riboflavin kinase/FAD synthetase [Xanthomonadaceae bacterium]|nr:bifunctional riboflavin kinase/FAD synthetase [Xanthomonadaceae bacterium]MDE1884404.1 bifunctional riboflavin kinase/FAD synthetase [Xanthomonadaceae bacterium]MDE2083706.1 bifunctional riboflavin kinase/FAD synthetase [Xanthomonadaceae bacterium]MDE2256180.1 bifunctional riboflavin kinase/FAD synthetase [Xanthomonadaceae bacterium]
MNWLHRDVAGPCLAPRGSAVCIGAFDGVHRGHRAVLAKVRQRAQMLNLEPVAISFAPIPRVYFAGGAAVPQLSSVREKILALRDAGMSRVLLLRFDARLAAMSAADFIARVLVKRIGAREVWVGEGFRFGHGRAGDLAMLRREGAAHGLHAETIEAFVIDGERTSSSRIRALLAAGDFDAAACLLGRRFAIGGHVVRGAQLGRKLGYPTANVRLGSRTAPVGGVFAVRVRGVRDAAMPGVASLGTRPTVDGREVLLEAHLFNFDGDLYGKRIEVEFVQKLRDEEKFDNLDAMVRQIDLDAQAAREILSRSTTATAGVSM